MENLHTRRTNKSLNPHICNMCLKDGENKDALQFCEGSLV